MEIAIWEQEGQVHLSDRGGLSEALLLGGVDMVESASDRARVESVIEKYDAVLRGVSVIKVSERSRLGRDVQSLLQSLLDSQVVARETLRRAEIIESSVFNSVRQLLDTGEARYRENIKVSGALGRTYRVDFKIAFETDAIMRAVMVVATTDRTLELAERWNFRFGDIRRARPSLHRLFLVHEGATWTNDAHRTIAQQCERVFPPGEMDALPEYLATAEPAAS